MTGGIHLDRKKGLLYFDPKEKVMQHPPPVQINRIINTKTTMLMLFFSLLAFAIVMYHYSVIELREEHLRVYFGSADIIIHFSNDKSKILTEKNKVFNTSNKPILIVFWSRIYQKSKEYLHEKQYIYENGYSFPSCDQDFRVTFDTNEAKNADVIIVNIQEANNLPTYHNGKTWILEVVGTPNQYPEMQNETFMKLFQYSIGISTKLTFIKQLSSFDSQAYYNIRKINSSVLLDKKKNQGLAIISNCNKTLIKFLSKVAKLYNLILINNCDQYGILRNKISSVESRVDRLINVTRLYKYFILAADNCSDFIDETLFKMIKTGSHVIYYGNRESFANIPFIYSNQVIYGNHFKSPEELVEFMTSNKMSLDIDNNSKVIAQSNTLNHSMYSLGCQISKKVLGERASHLNPLTC